MLKCFILCIYKCKSRLILEGAKWSAFFFLHENNVCFLKMVLKGFFLKKKKHFNRRKIVLIQIRLITISQNFFVRMSDIFILWWMFLVNFFKHLILYLLYHDSSGFTLKQIRHLRIYISILCHRLLHKVFREQWSFLLL